MRILVIDVGGSHVKALATGHRTRVRIDSGPTLTAAAMARQMKAVTAGWKYDAVTIGYPGPVVNNRPVAEPKNLGGGWVRYNYRAAFHKPVRIMNDAAMQALGSYRRGRMLFLGLGTGLGATVIDDGHIFPLEIAHLPFRDGEYEDYVGEHGREKLGHKKWEQTVHEVTALFRHAFVCDDVVIGGGNARRLKSIPAGARLGDNANAFKGGRRVWE
ncbi:MAG TPA: ROK family protein [Gemmatimonadaceae bacterium]|nr:ROK family protein [Gemmatimonadaceae bacterium]